MTRDPEPLPIALRAYAPQPRRAQVPVGPSEWTLVFDCETSSDTAHALCFGAFQVRQGTVLQRSGFFFDPAGLSAEEQALLRAYAEGALVDLLPVAEFVEDVLFHVVYDLGGLCVGFNLPFDLSRMALRDRPSRGRFKGGFSFELSDDPERPRIRVQHRNSTSAFIEFVPRRRRRKSDHRGYFIDVRTIAKAILGEAFNLLRLADHLGTETRKADAGGHGGTLTGEYVAYCATDVQVTWECFVELRERYASYGLTQTPLTRLTSEASIGKGSLREMNIEPWQQMQPRFPHEITGLVLSTYSGGRSEVRLRRQIAEVSYCDFRSMYPTVCTLMGLWEFVIAHGMDHRDTTSESRALLERIELGDLQDPHAWRGLRTIVQIRPAGDRLPVRAAFGELADDPDRPASQYGMSQSPLTGEEPLWFTLADLIASKLITGKTAEVLQAITFEPRGPQDGLRAIDILGNPDYRLDPLTDDFYKRLIDMRAEVKAAHARAERDGDIERAARLDTEQQSMKLTANATSYGCFIELNAADRENPHQITAYGLDGEPFQTSVGRDEQPGRYFHPLLATLITGAARLMLVIAERLARDEGLDWAFMDTDSIAFIKPGGMDRAEFHECVQRIRDWFAQLNPYETKGSLLELEKVNHALTPDGKTSDDLAPLYCYAVSPKRYVLFNLDDDGRPVIRKASAHGLGHLLAPYSDDEAPTEIPAPVVPLAKLGVLRWQHDLWYRAIQAALAATPVDFDDLPGFDRPAMTSYSISTQDIARWFAAYNEGKPYREQIRAFGFLISPIVRAFDKPLGRAGQPFHLVAPFNNDTQSAWATTTFADIYTGKPYGISTSELDEITARVPTYREVATRYLDHPDPRRVDGHGQPCRRTTTGLLEPRHIHAIHVQQIGKEANRLDETAAGLIHDPADIYTTYRAAARDTWTQFVLPVLDDMPRSKLAATTNLDPSTITDTIAGRSEPHAANRRKLIRAAHQHARITLAARGIPAPRNKTSLLHAYLQQRDQDAQPRCPVCHEGLVKTGATYCSAACKQKAYRDRQP